MNDQSKSVACPTCGAAVKWSAESRWRPFCSERCRLIDLGEWLEEEERIPGEPHFPPERNSGDY